MCRKPGSYTSGLRFFVTTTGAHYALDMYQNLRRLKQKLNEALETLQTLPYFQINDSVIELRNNCGIKNTNGAQVRSEQVNLQQEGQWLFIIVLHYIILYIITLHFRSAPTGISGRNLCRNRKQSPWTWMWSIRTRYSCIEHIEPVTTRHRGAVGSCRTSLA